MGQSVFLRRAAGPVVLFVVVSAFYAQAVNYEFIYDDLILIVESRAPQSAGEVLSIFAEGHWEGLPYYRPVARLTMVLQKYLHGNNPAPYHGFNALLMGTFAVVTWLLFRQPPLAIRPWPAVLGAALVAVHPVASCTVYPICSGRETLMPAIFIVAAVTAFLRPGRRWYVVALVLFAVSLLCKEQAVIVPGLFILADTLGLSPFASKRFTAWLRRYLPVVGILLAYFLVRWQVLHGSEEVQLAVFDRPSGPALSYLYALQMSFVPFIQLVYEPPASVWFSQWRLVVCAAVMIGLAALTYRHWTSAGKRVLFWLGWFVLALLPTANILGQEASFAERFVLLALVAVVGLAVMLASLEWERTSARFVLVSCGVVLLVACGWISLQRGEYYASDSRFLRQWVHTNPKSHQAHLSLGRLLLHENHLNEAVTHLERSLRLNPSGAIAHNNLGLALEKQGRFEEAVAHFQESLRLNQDTATAHNNWGLALQGVGRFDEAVTHYQEAVRIRPDYAQAHNNCGTAFGNWGRFEEAVAHLQQALRIKPDYAEAHNNVGNALQGLGRLEEAVAHYQEGLRINPDDAEAHYNLGIALMRMERVEEAVVHYRKALLINPDIAEIHNMLGTVLMRRGELMDAVKHFEHAVRLKPNLSKARENLRQAQALLQQELGPAPP